jgi:Holliday junction resolvase
VVRKLKASELKIKESDIQRTIKEYLQIKGWLVKKIQQSALSEKGIADLFALKAGRTIWVEVKTKIGKQSHEQVIFEQDVKSHGGEYLIARSVDDVINYLLVVKLC